MITFLSQVKENKVIPGKEVENQYHVLALDVFLSKEVKSKNKFRKKFKLWIIRGLKNFFTGKVNKNSDGKLKIRVLWKKSCQMLSKKFLLTPRANPDIETWWWNKDVDVAVFRRRDLFKVQKQIQSKEDRSR